ncbi:hypothetical protein ACTXT7_013377 [Hymenolepis weldensis]
MSTISNKTKINVSPNSSRILTQSLIAPNPPKVLPTVTPVQVANDNTNTIDLQAYLAQATISPMVEKANDFT